MLDFEERFYMEIKFLAYNAHEGKWLTAHRVLVKDNKPYAVIGHDGVPLPYRAAGKWLFSQRKFRDKENNRTINIIGDPSAWAALASQHRYTYARIEVINDDE